MDTMAEGNGKDDGVLMSHEERLTKVESDLTEVRIEVGATSTLVGAMQREMSSNHQYLKEKNQDLMLKHDGLRTDIEKGFTALATRIDPLTAAVTIHESKLQLATIAAAEAEKKKAEAEAEIKVANAEALRKKRENRIVTIGAAATVLAIPAEHFFVWLVKLIEHIAGM